MSCTQARYETLSEEIRDALPLAMLNGAIKCLNDVTRNNSESCYDHQLIMLTVYRLSVGLQRHSRSLGARSCKR